MKGSSRMYNGNSTNLLFEKHLISQVLEMVNLKLSGLAKKLFESFEFI